MFYLIIVLFVLGYTAIAFEQHLPVDKAAIALITGALIWVCIALGGDTVYVAPSFQEYLHTHRDATVIDFVTRHELAGHLGKIGEILFYLLGVMTIVEIIESHGGFSLFPKIIKTAKKVKLIWLFSFLTFFLSAVLDNLTITIVMITLMWKMISSNSTRCFYAAMIVIAANAGGACSPIGNVTTLMLWNGGQVSAWNIILQLFVPSLICMLVPLIVISLGMKGEAVPPSLTDNTKSQAPTTDRERWIILLSGIGGLILVPVFKSATQLPPYMGVIFVLSVMWMMIEILHRKKQKECKIRLSLPEILKKIDTPAIFFFLGILLAVAGLKTAGHLYIAGNFLSEKVHNIYAINLLIGMLSSVVDNVPLVAGAMGMYEIVTPEAWAAVSNPTQAAYLKHFVADGSFWELLAYSAGNGGSILIIGSSAGVAAMNFAKIEFNWYLKKISLLVLAGYLAGFAAYFLIVK